MMMLPQAKPKEKLLSRILSEQRLCAAYLLSDQPDKAGARAGLADWVMEEVIIRTNLRNSEERGAVRARLSFGMEQARLPD